MVLCIQNSSLMTKIACLYESQPSCVVFGWKTAPFGLELQGSVGQKPHLLFLLAKFVFWTRITSLYGSQTLPVVLCMKNCNFTTRHSILNGSHTSSAVLSTHNSVLSTRTKNYIGSRPHLWFCTCKTVTLGLELQVSVGPRPNLWILHAKQRLLDQNNKSLCFPLKTCHFVHVQERA